MQLNPGHAAEMSPCLLSRRTFVRSFGTVGALGLAGCLGTTGSDGYDENEPLVVAAATFLGGPTLYTDDCHCCDDYAAYVEETADVTVEVVEVGELAEVKKQYGVPEGVEACHTVDAGKYFIEGHVPLEAVGKLAEETPAIAGVSLPGKPSGSPGMSGRKREEFVIYAIRGDGSYEEFMRI